MKLVKEKFKNHKSVELIGGIVARRRSTKGKKSAEKEKKTKRGAKKTPKPPSDVMLRKRGGPYSKFLEKNPQWKQARETLKKVENALNSLSKEREKLEANVENLKGRRVLFKKLKLRRLGKLLFELDQKIKRQKKVLETRSNELKELDKALFRRFKPSYMKKWWKEHGKT